MQLISDVLTLTSWLASQVCLPVCYSVKTWCNFIFQVGSELRGLDPPLVSPSGTTAGQPSSHLPWQQTQPALFDGLGCLSAFTHQSLLDPVVHPVIQPFPLALRKNFTAGLRSLLEAGIIEPVNAAPWISNLVVIAWKKLGDLHIFVDLRAVNGAIIPDKYPQPTHYPVPRVHDVHKAGPLSGVSAGSPTS